MGKTGNEKSYKMDENTKKVINYFEQICQIPRGSGNEAGIREYLIGWANENKYDNNVDEVGNLFIRVPATKGMENNPPIVLQGHMDMVCEKRSDVKHDFTKDPIKTIIDGEWLKADGTTLGADDGIALALSMALVSDPKVKHPDLELLFTVDEETGLTGALGIGEAVLRGKYLINIDLEVEGVFVIGCAGGQDTKLSLDLEYDEVPNDYVPWEINVYGGVGGHSGENINCERANAIRVLTRVLQRFAKLTDIRIININAGTAHNVIPREAKATFFAPVADSEIIKDIAKEMDAAFKNEFAVTDPDISLKIDDNFEPEDRRAMLSWLSVKVLDFLRAIPHGVAANDKRLNMTETSSNLAIVKIEEGRLIVRSNQRSSVISRLDSITSRVESVGRLAGAQVWSSEPHLPWQPDFNSNFLKQCLAIYKKLFVKEAKVCTIHAGLECGAIGNRHPGMEMVSIGIDTFDIHSPNERLSLPSVGRGYELLSALLANLK